MWRLLPAVVLFFACFFACVAPSAATVWIKASGGGEVGPFLELFAAVRQSGERVVIDGPCFSACTLVLSIVPGRRICVTRRAILGFHAARIVTGDGRDYAAPRETHLVAATYPPAIRAWINRHGGLTARPIFLRGREPAAIYPRCR